MCLNLMSLKKWYRCVCLHDTLINPGDEVIYPNPGFPIYESNIKFVVVTHNKSAKIAPLLS